MSTGNNHIINDVATYFGLTISYVDEIPSGVCGLLSPFCDPPVIVVSRSQPKPEQVFTIAHELGHYLLHSDGRRLLRAKGLFARRWESRFMAMWSKASRRYARKLITLETEADGWAICALMQLGQRDVLRYYLERHPERIGWCCLFACSRILSRVKSCIRPPAGTI